MAVMKEKSKSSHPHVPRPHLLAAALLLAMAALFALGWHFQLPALKAFAEAALVGGIADWFAVTALFRHPLGLPIPHTALVPANQRRLGRALGDFVCDNFLAPDLVVTRLRQTSPSAWLADRLAEPALAQRLARRLVRVLDDDDSRVALAGLIRPGPPLAHGLRQLMRQHWHQRAFDRLLDAVQQALVQDNGFILAKVSDGSGRWMPAWVDRKLADKLAEVLAAGLDDLRRSDHPWRQGLETWLEGLAERLRDDPALAERLAEMRDASVAAWQPQAELAPVLAAAIATWARKMAGDSAARARLDRRLIHLTERVLLPNRQEIGDFIADVVARWDSATLVAKLEGQVGRDLQYIRVNGTVVGGLVGLALWGLTHLLG